MTGRFSLYSEDLLAWVLSAPDRVPTESISILHYNPRVQGDVELCPISPATKKLLLITNSFETELNRALSQARADGSEEEQQNMREGINLMAVPLAEVLRILGSTQATRDADVAGHDVGSYYATGIADGAVVVGYPTREIAATAFRRGDARRARRREIN